MEPSSHAWTEIVSSSVVPIVIISACGLLCLAFYNRLGVIVTRLRSLQRERLAEYKEIFRLEDEKKGKLVRSEAEQFLHFLEGQTVEVMKRARYLRNCLVCLIWSIFCFVVTSLLIGLSIIFPFLEVTVPIFFVIGLLLILYGLIYALLELRIALNPIQTESGFVQQLLKNTTKSD